jgi:cobalt-zinc-cadmium efflux system protein
LHAHAPKAFGRAFALAATINIIFIGVEVAYGFIANSTALIADATHNAGDVLGLLLSWGAYTLAKRVPTTRFTYGYRSTTILATLASGLLFLFATGSIFWEAIRRFSEPVPVEGGIVVIVATIGIVINSIAAWLLSKGENDLNIKSAFWHLVADAAVSAGVVVTGFFIIWTGAPWLDPFTSILIAAVILWSTWGLFRDAIRMSLQAVPSEIDITAVRTYLVSIPGVTAVHDLHVWPISTSESALTVHVIMPVPRTVVSYDIAAEVQKRFGIGHTTVQVETAHEARQCRLESDEVI